MCAGRSCGDESPCKAPISSNTSGQCNEDFILYAPSCQQITITELDVGVDAINWCPRAIPDGN